MLDFLQTWTANHWVSLLALALCSNHRSIMHYFLDLSTKQTEG